MNTRNRTTRLVTVALGVFGFAAALSATAGIAECQQCLDNYHACRSDGSDFQSCVYELQSCQRSNRCAIWTPPDQ